jgi:glycosyltransferase involved in cell wall biosynthesis
MKIAFLTPEYPHPKTGNSGGIGSSIKNLALGLIQQGHEVRVLVYSQKEEAFFDDNGVLIQQIKNVKVKGLSWYFTRKKLEKIINLLFDQKQVDIVEAADWTGITSFIQPKHCPMVIRLHGSDTYFCHLDQRPVKWYNRFHERRALKKADGLISVSQFTADVTNEVFGLKKDFSIIPNGIDTRLFKNNTNNNTNNSILYFGSLIRKKGLLELPFIFNEVIKRMPLATLVLVGRDVPDVISENSSTWQMMQQLFTPAALQQVSYLGAVPYLEIKGHLEEAQLCLFPSFAEALPVSWIEAMVMQKPIVASNIGWATEMIDDGINGFLVHPKDHLRYADRILELLEDKGLQKEFGIKAKKKARSKFGIEVVAKQSSEFYSRIVRRRDC